ncbi:hypothetical protein FHX64_002361 [Microbacter margulisiae]|uniref:Uncharacterized protein n=1 Tax=Microbacter margulisiae TaxID=1350067 RepID=A0A7W5H202_9PORP|nr:hypothetical protein [Microbacter margulisiae]
MKDTTHHNKMAQNEMKKQDFVKIKRSNTCHLSIICIFVFLYNTNIA